MRRWSLLIALCVFAVGCGETKNEVAQQPEKKSEPVETGPFLVGQPVRHENLTIFPILSKTDRKEDRYVTLDEGLKNGTVEVFEVDAAGAIISPPGRFESLLSRAWENRRLFRSILPTTLQVGLSVADLFAPSTDLSLLLQAARQHGGQLDGGGEVNRLMVRNKSGKPLYLMPGEVVVGGYQDRTIAQETIIASGEKPVSVDVFCVEHGRWAGRDDETTAKLLTGINSLSKGGKGGKANINQLVAMTKQGKFALSAGSLSKSTRLAAIDSQPNEANPGFAFNNIPLGNLARITGMSTPENSSGTGQQGQQGARSFFDAPPTRQLPDQDLYGRQQGAGQQGSASFFDAPPTRALPDQDLYPRGGRGFGGGNQSAVWNRVALVNSSSGANIDSGAFTANYANEDVTKKLKPYLEQLEKTVADKQRIVGVIVAVNGKVETVDLFESTPLFRKLWPKLLKSYALDAVVVADAKKAKAACEIAAAVDFLQKAMTAKPAGEKSTAGLIVTKRSGKHLVSFSAGKQKEAGVGNGGFGGAVHASAFSE